MARRFLALAAAALAAALPAAAAELFLAPRLEAPEIVRLEPPLGKATAPTVDASGLLRVGEVRALPKAQALPAWRAAAGGYVTRFRVTSEGAQGLRVRLDLGAVPGAMLLHARGDDAAVEEMDVDPVLGPEAWTPWTDGETQVIELFSRVEPSPGAVRVGAVLHLVTPKLAKAAASCTVSTACASGDPGLDAMIAERKKSVAKIQFIRNGSGYQCSGTLIDSPRRPTPFFLTANHCVDDAAAATSATSLWFYESTSCGDDTPAAGAVQVAGGMQLVFTNFNVDATLLQMNRPPPAGAVFAPVDARQVAQGARIVSISHPRGDTARWGTGSAGGLLRDNERPYDMYSVNFDRGIIEPGSSGSGLFTANNGRLELRGVLSQGADDLSCTQPTLFTLYSRMEVFSPEIARFIGAAAATTDDAPNRPQDVTATVSPVPIDTRATPIVLADRRIDYPGDIDVYKFTLAAPAVVTAYTTGGIDTVGTLLDTATHAEEAVDDAQTSDTNTGITRALGPGAHYLSVGHWLPEGTGAYGLTLRADVVGENYTALWWNEGESGWGINVNHQQDIVFATLFTYGLDGSPLWLVMSRGERQPDGSFRGTLFRTTGPAFNAAPWTGFAAQEVGTMTLSFASPSAGTLTYTFAGRTVTKAITRQAFRALPTCSWSFFDRSFARNFTDLWWNPSESGWGVNLTQQEDVLFATLFTYNASGQPMWYVMSKGEAGSQRGTWTGTLYRATGPAFDASPWTGMNPVPVGSMSFAFTNGNAGTMTYTVDGITVTKQIQRQVFGALKTQCES